MPSGRKKGGTNKYWNAEEKEKILLECKQKGMMYIMILKNG